jgi:hypothetical protein
VGEWVTEQARKPSVDLTEPPDPETSAQLHNKTYWAPWSTRMDENEAIIRGVFDDQDF